MGELTGLTNPRRLLALATVLALGVAALLLSVGPNPHTRLTAIQGVAALFFLTVIVRSGGGRTATLAERPQTESTRWGLGLAVLLAAGLYASII